MILFDLFINLCLPSHKWDKYFWHFDTPIRLLIIFYDRYHSPTQCYRCSIIHMYISFASCIVLIFKSRTQSSGLVVSHIICTMSFTKFILRWDPSIDIYMPIVYCSHISCTTQHYFIRQS